MAEPMIFEEELDRAVNADPFISFTIVTAGGDRYDVPTSNWIAFGDDVVVVLRPKVGSVRIRSYNIVAIELHEAAH
jgi:hypothetical protein